MKKLLILIAALIMCNAYGEDVWWVTTPGDYAVYTASSKTTCTNKGNITLPENPTAYNRRFIGWKEGTTEDLWKIQASSSTYSSTNKTFSVTFPYATVGGISQCSATSISGSYGTPCANASSSYCPNQSTISNTAGRYCWCKLTSITITDNTFPVASQIISASNAKWRPLQDLSTLDSCNNSCTNNCAFSFGRSHYYNMRKRYLTGK